MCALALCAASTVGCAHTAAPRPQTPDAPMAQTVLEIHRAKQAGAEYNRESAAWCHKAEQALARSRRLVWKDRADEAAHAAREGLLYAQKARALARLPARVWQAHPEAVLGADTVIASAPQ